MELLACTSCVYALLYSMSSSGLWLQSLLFSNYLNFQHAAAADALRAVARLSRVNRHRHMHVGEEKDPGRGRCQFWMIGCWIGTKKRTACRASIRICAWPIKITSAQHSLRIHGEDSEESAAASIERMHAMSASMHRKCAISCTLAG